MSLFVKHVADKQQFHVTIPCFSLTLRRLPTQSRSRHFGGISEKKTRSDHVTRNASHQPRGIMRPTDKATADSRSVQSLAIIKSTGHGNCFTLAVFTLELKIDYPSETSLCTVTPSSTDTPSPFLLLRGGGRLYTGYLKWIIHLQLNCPSKLTEKARRIVLIQN